MKKTLVTGLLAVGLIATGGTGLYLTMASANADSAHSLAMMKEMNGIMKTGTGDNQGLSCENKSGTSDMQKMMGGNMSAGEMQKMMGGKMSAEEMQKMMEDGSMDFESMKPYMKKMHPNLTDKQLEDLFKSMQKKGCAVNAKTKTTKANSL